MLKLQFKDVKCVAEKTKNGAYCKTTSNIYIPITFFSMNHIERHYVHSRMNTVISDRFIQFTWIMNIHDNLSHCVIVLNLLTNDDATLFMRSFPCNVAVTFLNVPIRYWRCYAKFYALNYFFLNNLEYPNLNVM